MLSYLFDEILSLFKRRSRKQSRGASIVESLFIYSSAACLFFGIFGSQLDVIPMGSKSALFFACSAVFFAGLWFAITRKSELKFNLHGLWFLPSALIVALCSDGVSACQSVALFLIFFVFISFSKFRRDAYIMSLALVLACVFAALYGFRAYALSGATFDSTYGAPAIGAGLLKYNGALALLFCATIPFVASAFVSAKFSSAVRVFAVSIFGLVWYSTFRTSNLLALSLATVATLSAPFLYAVVPHRKFFAVWLFVLAVGTWGGVLMYDAPTVSAVEEASAAVNNPPMAQQTGDVSSDGIVRVLGGINAKTPALADFFAKYGAIAGALLLIAFFRIFVRGIKIFLKIPVEKSSEGKLRYIMQSREKVFGKDFGRDRFHSHTSMPIERIIVGAPLLSFAVCGIVFAFVGDSFSFRTAFIFAAICSLLVRCLWARREVKKYFGFVRALGILICAGVFIWLAVGSAPLFRNFFPKKYGDAAQEFKAGDISTMGNIGIKTAPMTNFESPSELSGGTETVLGQREFDADENRRNGFRKNLQKDKIK